MVSDIRKSVVIVVLMLLLVPALAGARSVHYFPCGNCHRGGFTLTDLKDGTLCMSCHDPGASATTLNDSSSSSPNGRFVIGDASNAMGSNPAPAKEVSHMWGAGEINPAAGAQLPTINRTQFDGKYGISRGTVACSRCHNPHGDNVDTTILKVDNTTDGMCTDCHLPWNVANADALETHPAGIDYATFEADTARFKAAVDIPTAAGDVRLVGGKVSCTSCHNVHFADSDSSTVDGVGQTLNQGDGHLLRSDGPLVTGPQRNLTDGTAQLRSNLCQACHTYQVHGKGASDDHQIGCLECHGGHSYNGGSPNAFVLRADNPDVPTRPNGVNGANASVTFGAYAAGGTLRTKWSDDVNGTANGYCEQCHGDVQDPANIGSKATEHLEGDSNDCSVCHKHNDPAAVHSFNVDASAATCGACHGFPPHLSGAGNRDSGGVDGGYAFNDVDTVPVADWDYFGDSGYYKDEATTAHNTHAGNNNDPNYYFVGNAGIENCRPCHGDNAGSGAGGHRQPGNTETFRNVPFNAVASANGNLSPVYNTGPATCDNVYCHTNGTPRIDDFNRDYTGVHTTPGWDGGKDAIFAQPNRCSFCHGDDATTMGGGDKNNSARHQAHLGAGPMAITFGCEVCHSATAASNSALQAGATDGRTGGTHVNSVVDVVYAAGGSDLYNALGVNAVGESYNSTTGTCSIYCHDVTDTGATMDWDSGAALNCDSCHGGLSTDGSPIATGSHPKHVTDALGPQLACADCHGTNAGAGTHTGHLDGLYTVTAGVCDSCHGWDAGETALVWGSAATSECVTCHTGASTSSFGSYNAPDKSASLTIGHNKASGNYAVSSNPAAGSACLDCHVTSASGHFDGLGNSMLLRTDGTFPATYAGNENVFCDSCHGTSGTATVTNINTHMVKNCVACHDPHGDDSGNDNIFMVRGASGDYSGTVRFKVRGDSGSPQTATDSYDEDDASDGGVSEDNADDLCATCHSSASNTDHNNQQNSDNQAPGGHNMGKNCFDCHNTHTDVANAFGGGAGTACNDCHGFPPATGAHGDGTNLHSRVTTTDKDIEDISDCAYCHTGADSYTYAGSGDQPGLNHGDAAGRKTILTASVGYNSTNGTCASACHASTVGDGAWSDGNGLDCTACHAYAPADARHNAHVVSAGKACSDCHSPIDTAGTSDALTHITESGATEGLMIAGNAQALADEANIDFTGGSTSFTFDDGLNTCGSATNNGLGCHATGSADWDDSTTADDCIECHTDTTTAAANPTSGLHGGPLTVTGNSHDDSFDDGAAGTAGCITCHTATPSSAHTDGTLDVSAPTITIDGAIGFADAATPSCANTCHSAGTNWSYLWSATAKNSDGSECENCHGTFGNSWNAGTIHAASPAAGGGHNTGVNYTCTDCHAIEAAAAVYTFTSGSADWAGAPASEATHHGDGTLQINDNGTSFSDDSTWAGCTGCHGIDAGHRFPSVSGSTNWTLGYLTGDVPQVSCSGCHGNGTAGTDQNNYWPDGINTWGDNSSEDNAGAHLPHVTAIATEFLGQADIAELLTDNAGSVGPYNSWTSDAKQKYLCSFCHGTLGDPLADGTHGDTAYLPADVSSMHQLWDAAADDAIYTNATDSCSSVNCHKGKTTPATNDWYAAPGSGDCATCHIDIPSDNTHADHTGAQATFGRSIGCADCHDAATDWAGNVKPANGTHIDGTLDVGTAGGSGVAFTYGSPVAGSCGTNACHENGKGGAPNNDGNANYIWTDDNLGDCTTCHQSPNSAGNDGARHTTHIGSALGYGCTDCHTAETAATHIDDTTDLGGSLSTYNSGDGSCTNNCHVATDGGDWTDVAALACTDCHSGTYVGGGSKMPQYNMHVVTPVTSGVVHDDTLVTCSYCHSGISGLGSHIDGTWAADSADNAAGGQGRGLFAAFTDAAVPSCSGAGVNQAAGCHLDDGLWARKWNASAAANDETRCANCHGYWAAGSDGTGWRTGVSHAENPTRGSSSAHNDASGAHGYECFRCHVLGDSGDTYKWTDASNDWWPTDAGTNTWHGDGNITMNDNGPTANEHDLSANGRSGCIGCHEGADAAGVGNGHDFPASSFALGTLTGADAANEGGGCDACHGGAGEYAPNDPSVLDGAYPNRAGKHAEHVSAIATKLGGDNQTNRNASCNYCHLNPGEPGHNDNVLPSANWDIRHILNYNSVDANPVINRADNQHVTCSTIDCHFNNAVTPHWYTDDVAPAAVTLTAVAGPDPRTIKVSWNAPGDDGNTANTTPYVYDMRYSTVSGTGADAASDYTSTVNHVGGLPAAYAQGYASEVIVENLNPGTTYYFSLKSRDTAGNWSTASAETSAQPTADTVPPSFGGADKAVKGDEGASINLYWTAAEDHTMPITYDIWMKDEASGALDMDVDTPVVTGWTDTKIELNASHGVVNDTIYNLGVRACDALSNCETNTLVVSATPTDVPLVDKTYHTYRTATTTAMVKDGPTGAGNSTTLTSTDTVFAGGAQGYSVKYFVDTFAIFLDPGNNTPTVTAEIGTYNGSTFSGSGITKSVTLGKRAARVYQFKLVDINGITVPAGESIAIALTDPSGATTADFGTAATRGDATIAEQIVNIAPTAATDNGTTLTGAIVDMQWNASTDAADGLADTVHYDLYGSNNGGLSYDYVIAEGLDAATTSYQWDTQTAGITSGSLAVRINSGDGYAHTTTDLTGLGTADAVDYVAPAAIDDLVAQARPKSGSVLLSWSAPGDDYGNHGRADYYDVRYDTRQIVESGGDGSTTVNWADIPVGNWATGEPSPDFGGEHQTFEVTGLTPGQNYYFAIKTVDEGGNVSALSTAKSAGSDQEVGGPRCGMCHTTAPSVVESVGNHKLHGFTIADCTKCHGAAAASYTLAHQDGSLEMGYGPGGPHPGIIAGNRIYYTDDGTPGGTVLYDDTDGFGGFGTGDFNPAGDGVDDGTCTNFGALGVGGCHGPAGTDPDGAGPLPTYPIPNWNAAATLDCSACHGNPNRTTDAFYGREFDGTIANGMTVPDQILGVPPVDNHGNYDLAAPLEEDRKFIGQHEKHINYSFRFSKGDSCNLCHTGKYADRNDLDGRHANGVIDVQLDTSAAGPNATWTPGTATTAGTCSNLSPDSCHPSAATPTWDSAANFDCVGCHTMGGTLTNVGHYTDPTGGITLDTDPANTNDGGPMLGNCTWCHFAGHPRDDVGGAALILANSSQVGINYRSGGIHLRKSIGGRAAAASEAELCWGCHDTNGISEWGTDTGSNNTSTAPPNASDYDYGSVDTSNWTTATWTSAVPNFAYKTGAIQSTHTTNELGSSAVSGTAFNYSESPDAVAQIRCSNCHDVHNLNKAPGDTMTGQPYLRGTWVRNPYPEDGAPWNKTYAVTNTNYGAVPRAGGTGGNEQGGYQIDQNNNSPTAGLSLATSAGLCTLCHGTDVDNMDKTGSESLWVGSNGHSNAALGGTAANASNIFGDNIGGRPAANASAADQSVDPADIYNMGVQVPGLVGTTNYGYGYRGQVSGPKYTPGTVDRSRAYNDFFWGVSVDASTVDIGYHAFTCSKCHNPHASRLPKLMITNCLDTSHNTWDENNGSLQTYWNSTDDNGETTATHNTAQNCHRYDPNDGVGGWNKVTPW